MSVGFVQSAITPGHIRNGDGRKILNSKLLFSKLGGGFSLKPDLSWDACIANQSITVNPCSASVVRGNANHLTKLY